MPTDYFSSAHRGFKATAWLLLLLLLFSAFTFISESYGRTPSTATTILVLQVLIEFILCATTARLFKKKSSAAILTGYITLFTIVACSVFFYGVALKSVVGVILAAALLYLFVILFKAGKQDHTV